jgi:hypothetical protein
VRLGGKSFQEQRSDRDFTTHVEAMALKELSSGDEQKPYYFLLHVLPPISLPKFRLWNKKIYTPK